MGSFFKPSPGRDTRSFLGVGESPTVASRLPPSSRETEVEAGPSLRPLLLEVLAPRLALPTKNASVFPADVAASRPKDLPEENRGLRAVDTRPFRPFPGFHQWTTSTRSRVMARMPRTLMLPPSGWWRSRPASTKGRQDTRSPLLASDEKNPRPPTLPRACGGSRDEDS